MSNYGKEGGKQTFLLVTYFVLAICVHEGYERFFVFCFLLRWVFFAT